MQCSLVERLRFLLPSVILIEGGEEGSVALTTAQMTTNLKTPLREAGMEK